MEILVSIAVFVVIIGGVLGTFAYILAIRSKREYDASNEVVPGTPTPAPAWWAGAHHPEAKLHRRLRDAVAALRTVTGITGPDFIEARVTLENEALALDERLVEVAALPRKHRPAELAAVEQQVDGFEDAVTEALKRHAAES